MGEETGLTDLEQLIAGMDPVLVAGRWVFVSLPGGEYGDGQEWAPMAAVREDEGLTLVIPCEVAERAGLSWNGVFRALLLRVHSSLQAVGLTAAAASALARRGIPANVLAGACHDHILVPESRADEALEVLRELAREPGSR